MNFEKWRERVYTDNKDKDTVWDINGVFWIDGLNNYFIYILALRSFFRWWKKVILPNADLSIQKSVSKISNDIKKILELKDKDILVWDFKKLSSAKNRLPYMKTHYYFDEKFVLKNKETLSLVRDFWDKVFLANFMMLNWFENLLPKNTLNFILGNNFKNVKKESLNRFKNKQNFIVKAWEWASWENMILVFFENWKKYVAHYTTNWKKEIFSKEDFLNEFDVAIPAISRTKKWSFTVKWYDNSFLKEQYFLIQDLVDTKKYEEKSINFYIKSKEKIFPITSWKNIAVWWVHKWNIEEVFNEKIYKKFNPLLEKIAEKWYNWPIWFDFFLDKDSYDIKIIEANTRFTAPISPSMFVYKLEKLGKIPKKWTWKLLQKFDTKKDLSKICSLNNYNLSNILLKDKEIKSWAYFLIFSPILNNNYQSVMIIWDNQENIKKLENKINNILVN